MNKKLTHIDQFDRVDRRMLQELQRDGSLTNEEVSTRVHLSASICSRRRHRLEDAGVILGYVAVVDPAKVGYQASMFLEVKLRSDNYEDVKVFEDAVQKIDEVMDCWSLAGHLDYLIRVVVRDSQHFQRLHDEQMLHLPGVERIDTSLALRTVVRRTALPIATAG